MNLIDIIKLENWKYAYKVEQNNNGETYGVYAVFCEFSGTKCDVVEKKLSERNDIVIVIPMITLDVSTIKNPFVLKIVESEFYKYILGDMPTTKETLDCVRAKLEETSIKIEFEIGNQKSEVIIELSRREKQFLCGMDSFSFAITDKMNNYIMRVPFLHSNERIPLFPSTKMSLKLKKIEEVIPSIVENIDKLYKVVPSNLNTYLDMVGSSDYDVYQSTEKCESLPSLKNLSLGDYCYTCGKKETSREHCSPRWMTTKYKVKPLIGEIFCTECNSWFGKELERYAENELNIGNEINEEQCSYIVVWCLKTALTMSLASGVNINPQWLIDLRAKCFPRGFEVYFDTRYRLMEKGFNYGVSRFNKRLLANNMFLFSFICSEFGFIVINKAPNIALEIPLHKFYPCFMEGKRDGIFRCIADLHQEIHEVLSNEKTEEFSLPTREQKK